MHPSTLRSVAGLAIVIVYLAMQPGWDHFRKWAATWGGRPGHWAKTLRHRPTRARRIALAGRIVYSLAIPYIALLLGLADARGLGLAGLMRWPELPMAILLGVAGVGFLSWLWRRLSLSCYRQGEGVRLLSAEWQACHTPWGWVHLLAEVICLQMSWAFVRGSAIRLVGLYPGVFVGLVLVAGAWLLRPGSIPSLADPEARARTLLVAALAVISSLVFLYAENLWLAALTHGSGLLGATLAAGRAYRDSVATQ